MHFFVKFKHPTKPSISSFFFKHNEEFISA